MEHGANSKETVYELLGERLSKMPVGTPVNETLIEILTRLYTETEAMVGSKFPFVPMKLDAIAAIVGMKEEAAAKILDDMADKGLVVDLPRRDGTYYLLSPMVVGFCQFIFLRTNKKIPLKELAQLFNKYFEQTPEMIMEMTGMQDKLCRTFVIEKAIPAAVETEVMAYERASEIIRQSGGGAITRCVCRHMALQSGKPCQVNAPLEACTTMGEAAQWQIRHGFGKPATVDEMLRMLDQTEKLGLVHLGDNVKKPWFICHCCGCCCAALGPIKGYGLPMAHPSNFMAVVNTDNCTGCGICTTKCHIGAIALNDSDGSGKKVAEIQPKCIGCGVCVPQCPSGAITLSRRPEIHVPPVDKTELYTRIAREKDRMYFDLGPI